MIETANVDAVTRYLRAIEEGATGEALGRFLHDDVVQEEMPNRLNPRGQRRGKAGMLAGAEKGREILREQRYDVKGVVAQGDRVAVEFEWSGTLAVALGAMPEGFVMRGRFAAFFELRDGLIVAQRSYDCFEPW